MESIWLAKVLRIGTSNGIVIPREILKAHKIERGDRVIFGFAGNDQIYFRKVTDGDIKKIKGYEII